MKLPQFSVEPWLWQPTKNTQINNRINNDNSCIYNYDYRNRVKEILYANGCSYLYEYDGNKLVRTVFKDNKGDYTSYLTVTGTDLINKKANIEILLDTAEIIGDQYILDISYGEETLSKIIETPLEFCYTINADGTITIVEYTGSSKEIVIPGEYEGYTVSTIGEWSDLPSTENTYLPRQFNTVDVTPYGVTFLGKPHTTSYQWFRVYVWIDEGYTFTNTGTDITDPLQNAKIEVTWSTNSMLEQVSSIISGGEEDVVTKVRTSANSQ